MIEWIVLVWTVACPWVPSSFRGIQDCPDGNVQRFFISSTTAQFEQKWDSLSGKERETARVFKGQERRVVVKLELRPALVPISAGENVDGRCNAMNPPGDVTERCALDYGHRGEHQRHKNENGHHCTTTWE